MPWRRPSWHGDAGMHLEDENLKFRWGQIIDSIYIRLLILLIMYGPYNYIYIFICMYYIYRYMIYIYIHIHFNHSYVWRRSIDLDFRWKSNWHSWPILVLPGFWPIAEGETICMLYAEQGEIVWKPMGFKKTWATGNFHRRSCTTKRVWRGGQAL